MALNEKVFEGHHVPLNVGVGVKSGDPVAFGNGPLALMGVAEIDADANGMATVDLHGGVYSVSVKGVTNGAVNAVVNAGDTVYFSAGHTPKLDKDTTGVAWGTVLGVSFPYTVAAGAQVIASGATATVHVKVKTD